MEFFSIIGLKTGLLYRFFELISQIWEVFGKSTTIKGVYYSKDIKNIKGKVLLSLFVFFRRKEIKDELQKSSSDLSQFLQTCLASPTQQPLNIQVARYKKLYRNV